MDAVHKDAIPQESGRLHPDLFDRLFSDKCHIYRVFNDVLGLYGIDYIAMTYINKKNQILTLSSTPALEFNLFKSPFWRFDQTYQPAWYTQCTGAPWEALYMKPHEDALYYLKQILPRYPLGFSLSHPYANGYMIYSLASHGKTSDAQTQFKAAHPHFHALGIYCSQALDFLLIN